MAHETIEQSNKRFEQESDARTLAEAKIISEDSKRMKGAETAAKRIAEEKRKEAEGMKSVAEGRLKFKDMGDK